MNKLAIIVSLALMFAMASADIAGCKTVNGDDATICDVCNDGTYRAANKKSCPSCTPTNCDTCSDGTTCDTCDTGYFLSTDKKYCQPSSCDAAHGPKAGACAPCDDSKCTKCTKDSSMCEACPTNYVVLDSGACGLKCNDGNGLSSGACVKCSDANCLDCQNDNTVCKTCNAKFAKKDGASGTGACTACADTNCLDCTLLGPSFCTSCNAGYAPDSSNTATSKTVPCTACKNNCKTCSLPDDYCTACPANQGFNTTDATKKFCCPANCNTCNSTSYCTECGSGFNLNKDKGTCFGFKTGASLTLGAIVSVALFSLLF